MRVRTVFDLLKKELKNHTGVELHLGKTKVWNSSGKEPPRVKELQSKPEEPVWVGDRSLPLSSQGLKVLGAPLGTNAFAKQLGEKRLEDECRFWEQLPKLPDLQSSWLLNAKIIAMSSHSYSKLGQHMVVNSKTQQCRNIKTPKGLKD